MNMSYYKIDFGGFILTNIMLNQLTDKHFLKSIYLYKP